jgi:hypothetical protein
MNRGVIAGAVIGLQLLCSGPAQVVIVEAPQPCVAAPGTRVAFRVTASSGAQLFYQWQFNDVDVTGATNATLMFRATPARAGDYSVRIQDGRSEVSSVPVKLQVVPRPRVVMQPVNTIVGVGQTTAFQVELNASGPYTTIVWHNSNPVEGPHIIPDGLGADVHATRLIIAECADNPIYEGLYWISVTNAVGGTVSRRARLKVVGPPLIVRSPSDAVVRVGGAARFTVAWAPDEARRKACQWFKDGVAIPGATARVLNVLDATKQDEGWYWCVLASIGGRTESSMAQLKIIE